MAEFAVKPHGSILKGKEMHRAFQTFALILALSAFTYGGDMQFGSTGTPPPPPPPSPAMQEEQTMDGEISTGAAADFTESVVRLIESLLALF